LNVEKQTIGSQTKHCSGRNVEAQTELCLVEDTQMQTKDPCVFSQDNQMDHPTMDIVVQTDAKEDIPIGYWMIQ